MRVYLMLSHDVVFKPQLLHNLLLRLPYKIIGVAEIKPLRSKIKRKGLSSFEFWGIKGTMVLFFTILFRKVCSAIPFTPPYLRNRSTIKRCAKYFDIHYDLVDNVNDQKYLLYLKSIQPDVIVSFQHQIFHREILSIPNITCINCHPSRLPKYRGVKPIFWGMLNGDKQLGVTVHTMKPKIDAGEILCQKLFSIYPNSTLLDYYYTAYSLSSDAIVEALAKIQLGIRFNDLPAIPSSSTYYPNPSREDMRRFRSLKLKII